MTIALLMLMLVPQQALPAVGKPTTGAGTSAPFVGHNLFNAVPVNAFNAVGGNEFLTK